MRMLYAQRQGCQHKVAFRLTVEVPVQGQNFLYDDLVGKSNIDLVDQLPCQHMVGLHNNYTGGVFPALLVVLQIGTNVKRNECDLVLAHFDMVDLRKAVCKVDRHIVDRGIVFLELQRNGIGVADMEGTSLLRIIHVQGELQDIVVIKFRGAVPLGHHGKNGSHIVDELRADDTLDIHGFVLHRKGNQH